MQGKTYRADLYQQFKVNFVMTNQKKKFPKLIGISQHIAQNYFNA